MVLFEENMLYYKLDLYLDRIFSDLQKNTFKCLHNNIM